MIILEKNTVTPNRLKNTHISPTQQVSPQIWLNHRSYVKYAYPPHRNSHPQRHGSSGELLSNCASPLHWGRCVLKPMEVTVTPFLSRTLLDWFLESFFSFRQLRSKTLSLSSTVEVLKIYNLDNWGLNGEIIVFYENKPSSRFFHVRFLTEYHFSCRDFESQIEQHFHRCILALLGLRQS